MEIVFITDLEYQSYGHYISNNRNKWLKEKLCRLIDQNPNLKKNVEQHANAL